VADASLLAAAIDIEGWLRQDARTPYDARLERDREIGRQLGTGPAEQRVLGWWAEIRTRLDEPPAVGTRIERVRRLLTALLLLLGVAVGLGVGAAAFAYDGTAPVNLLALLAVLVGLPGLLLLLTLLALPGRVPGVRALGDTFAAFSLGRWAGVLLDRVSGSDLFAGLKSSRRQEPFARWQLVLFSQCFAVGFFVGVLGMAAGRIAFTDLAFGWSTTLSAGVDARSVHAFFAALAAPWSAWLPAASPDLALTEASRFNRLETGGVSAERAALLGTWWPFVLMCVASYGLVPRLALLVVSSWRLGAATRAWLLGSADVTALLDRLDSPSVTYQAAPERLDDAGSAAAAPPPSLPADASARAIVWNAAMAPERVAGWLGERFGLAPAEVISFDVLQTPIEWNERLEALSTGITHLVVVTKGWEPPVLEFTDFLELVRGAVGRDVTIAVVPVAVNGVDVDARDRDVWARSLGRLGDARLYVMDATRGDATRRQHA